MATDLYHRTVERSRNDPDGGKLMRHVWVTTPWMIDVYTGSSGDRRERDILEWCFDELGDECSPIHGRPGRWHRGGATVFGWTWYGFASREDMEKFLERWPTPADVAIPA